MLRSCLKTARTRSGVSNGRRKAPSPATAVARVAPTPLRRPPRIAVVIPAFNQAALTQQCLKAILGRDAAEVIVVNDASTDATPQMLGSFGREIKVVQHKTNRGFAATCNDGAAAARACDFVIFLNNDTRPQPGWLEALARYATAHPQAAVVGARLLFPNRTVQHAGVVICQDRYPRHIYTGFPADHPAVTKSRCFQIVTAACMLVRRDVFAEVGGFDAAFRNGFEDVDLCLRLGKRGHGVHYCADSVVEHLESVSPTRFHNDRDNVALYRRRWLDRVRPDDLDYYLEDGLLQLSYEGRYPISLEISPLLATVDAATRHVELERALKERSREVAELQRENTRLSLELGRHAEESPELRYQRLRQRIRETVSKHVPAGATVLVVSKGDGAVLELPGCRGWHFPQTERGVYAGHHPADSAEAIAQLEALRAKGGEYLLFPQTSMWWLEHYKEFKQHLERHYRLVAREEPVCLLFALHGRDAKQPPRQPTWPETGGKPNVISKSVRPERDRSSKKRVLYVCHGHPTVIQGGAEVYALEVYQSMRESAEFQAILLARVGSSVPRSRPIHAGARIALLEEDQNQYFFYTEPGDFDFFHMTSRNTEVCTRDFRAFLLTCRPDVVHFQHTHLLGYDLIREARETLPGAAIVYTLHEGLPICHRNGQMVRTKEAELCWQSSPQRCHECFPQISPAAFSQRKRLIQSHLSFVDIFVVPSRFLRERYVEWGIPREKLRYEEYGRWKPGRFEGTEANRPRSRLGFFGQINPFKGVDVLLRAMKILDGNRPTVGSPVCSGAVIDPLSASVAGKPTSRENAPHLWIHGANLELQRGDFQHEFRSLLEASKEHATFAGPYSQTELPRLMHSIDWVIVPSIWWENSPLVIQEAFMNQRPVICSNIGGLAEKVRDGVNGLHFRVGDSQSLAETLERAIATPGLWRTLVRGIPEVHPMQEHIRFLSSIYNRILETKVKHNCL